VASAVLPASTVTWSLHLTEPSLLAGAPASAWFWCEAETVHAGDGYATEQGRLYLDGRLVAWSEQLVAVYNPKPPPSLITG